MKLLIAGASGFVGRAVLERLPSDVEIIGLRRAATNASDDRLHWVEIDLAEPLERSKLPAQIDAVMHLAVSEHHRDFPGGAPDLFAVNTASVAGLLDYAAGAGASDFVYVSSGSVYPSGDGEHIESDLTMPDSILGATKLAAEILVTQYGQIFRTFMPRLYFPYGLGQSGRLVPSLVDRVADGVAVQLAGDDGLVIPPTHVSDVADVLTRSLTADWAGAMNVAAPEALSLRQIALTIGEQLGRAPIFEAVGGSAPRFQPDLTRLRSVVDVDGFVEFAEGIAPLCEARSNGD